MHGSSYPTTPFDRRDHFGEMGPFTSLSIVAARSLEGAYNSIIDSDCSETTKTVSRIAIGALTIIGVSSLSIIETISRVALAILGFSAVHLSCVAEILLKGAINIVLYAPLAILGQEDKLFAFPTFEDGRGKIIPFFFRPAVINAMSISVGAQLGAKMITQHKSLNFKECVWQDSLNEAFSHHNFVFSNI